MDKYNSELREAIYVTIVSIVLIFAYISIAVRAYSIDFPKKPETEIVSTAVRTSTTIPSTTTTTEQTTIATTATIALEPEPIGYFNVPLSEDLQNHIFELCDSYNVNPAMVVAMIERESSYRASAIGDNGRSYGLMQIQPRWNQERMDKLNCQDLLDPYQNIAVGIDLIAELQETGKSTEWVLMAYNGGQYYANNKVAQGVVSEYARTVMSNAIVLDKERG